jgi:hypothetical protein
LEQSSRPPVPRPEPLALEPLWDDPAVVSDTQLGRILPRLGLPAEGPPTLAAVDHLLRFWGPDAGFAEPAFLNGERLRSLITDHGSFSSFYGAAAPPLLEQTTMGVEVRVQQGPASSSHNDHTLATLAEIGTPLGFPLETAQGAAAVRDLLARSLHDFSLNQLEYEWSILVYALYLPPVGRWTTSEGQTIDFEDLGDRIMRQKLNDGVCSATHRLYALNAVLRADEQTTEAAAKRLLGPAARGRMTRFLERVTATLVRNQHPDGFWNDDWPYDRATSGEPGDTPGDDLAARLVVTGHVLEWWALAPAELQPPRPVAVAAGQWLVRTIDGLSDEEIVSNLSYLSHAGRALALWRQVKPASLAAPARATPEGLHRAD